MAKLTTVVDSAKLPVQCSLEDRILVLGSCFADEIGARLASGGFSVSLNPFGTLYNPASIAGALELLESGRRFEASDCVEMGAGAGKICSFRHHTSFARISADEFLENANSALEQARCFWKDCSKVIITLGTAFVWEHQDAGIVANCLKRNASEFTHRMMGMEECAAYLKRITELCGSRKIIFTVSPIRHMSLGAHSNTLSKATLHLALSRVMETLPEASAAYFPAYEILCDELRDYRFYAEDLVHPSKTGVDIIWERFLECCVPITEHNAVAEAFKASKRRQHISFTVEK